MKAPQPITMILMALVFGLALSDFSEGNKRRAWSSLFGLFVAAFLLTWGGFFKGAIL